MSGNEVPQDPKSKPHEDRKERQQPWVDMMQQPCRDQNTDPIQPLNMPFPRKSQRAARSHVHPADSSLDSGNHRTEQLAEQIFVICPSNLNLVQDNLFCQNL